MSRILANVLLILIIAFTASAVPINTDILNLNISFPEADEPQETVPEETENEKTYQLTYAGVSENYLYNPEAIDISFTGARGLETETILKILDTFEIDIYTNSGDAIGSIAKKIDADGFKSLCTYTITDDTLNLNVSISKEALELNTGHYQLSIQSGSDQLKSDFEMTANASYYSDSFTYNSTKAKPDNRNKILTLYFTDTTREYLVPVSREINYSGNLIRTTLNALRDGPGQNSGLDPVSPAPYVPAARFSTETEVVRLETNSYENGPFTLNEDDTFLMMHSLINTMTHIENVSYVKFSVDNKDTTPLNGFDLRKTYPRPESAKIYMGLLTESAHMYLLPLESESAVTAPDLFKELQRSTMGQDALLSPVPPEVELEGAKLENDVLTLTLSDSVFDAYEGNAKMGQLMMDSIVQSMCSLPGVDQIQLQTVSSQDGTLFTYTLGETFKPDRYINMEQ